MITCFITSLKCLKSAFRGTFVIDLTKRQQNVLKVHFGIYSVVFAHYFQYILPVNLIHYQMHYWMCTISNWHNQEVFGLICLLYVINQYRQKLISIFKLNGLKYITSENLLFKISVQAISHPLACDRWFGELEIAVHEVRNESGGLYMYDLSRPWKPRPYLGLQTDGQWYGQWTYSLTWTTAHRFHGYYWASIHFGETFRVGGLCPFLNLKSLIKWF